MQKVPLFSRKYKDKYTILDDDDYEALKDKKICFINAGKGYAVYYTGGDTFWLHRVIMKTPKEMDTDHINGDTLDNRKENLRVCTHQQNLANRKKQLTKSSSRYKGVSWSKKEKKWEASLYVGGKRHSLKYHTDEKAAAMAYNAKAKEIFGSFARLNEV